MRVLAFDVGTRNMGICMTGEGRLEVWDLVDLTGGARRVKDVPMSRMLDALHARIGTLTPDRVLIEQQMGHPYMGLSWAIYAYFLAKGTPVAFVHAGAKLRAWQPAARGGAYSQRKGWAVDAVHELLKFQDPCWAIKFAGCAKQDDMADAFLYTRTV